MNEPAIRQTAPTRLLSRHGLTALVRRFVRWGRDLITECAQAQRRMAELATAADRYLIDPNVAPDTYEEFLFRTSGLLRREPPARTSGRR